MRPNWKNFIDKKLEDAETIFSENFKTFISEIEILDLDYQEFDDEIYGEIGIYYFDIKWKGKELFARKTDQLEGDSCFWGLPSEEPDDRFDNWLEKTFDADIDEIDWFLSALEDYHIES